MNNIDNIQRVVGWKSKKNADGTFTATAYSFDEAKTRTIHVEYTRKTRARSVTAVKKACRFLKQKQRFEAKQAA